MAAQNKENKGVELTGGRGKYLLNGYEQDGR